MQSFEFLKSRKKNKNFYLILLSNKSMVIFIGDTILIIFKTCDFEIREIRNMKYSI